MELDWYTDWSVNSNFIVSFIAAVGEPGDGGRAILPAAPTTSPTG